MYIRKNKYIIYTSSAHYHYFINSSSIFIIGAKRVIKQGLLLFFSFLTLSRTLISQDALLGTPATFNHTKEDYEAGSQNWNCLTNGGNIYFANNGGLVTYNGIRWKTHATPKNTIMRSIHYSLDHKIYIGAQNEIGYFHPSANGTLKYVDLIDSLDNKHKNISEVWDICTLNGVLYFTSNNNVFEYRKNKSVKYGHDSFVSHMARVDNEIWYHSKEYGIYIINNGIERFLVGSEKLKDHVVIAILPSRTGRIFIITEKNGIYSYDKSVLSKWHNNAASFLKDKRISSAYYDEEYGLFIGTYLGGLLNINELGKTVVRLNKQNGLQNNTINCITLSPNGVIWCGTNNGIDEIDFSSPKQNFYPDNDLEGTVYDMAKWNGNLYFSTSHGLYHIPEKSYYNPIEDNKFTLVSGTNGQTWGTDIINGRLYCAHHEGPFKINDNNNAIRITPDQNAWKFLSVGTDKIVVGTYQGVSLYTVDTNGDLEYERKIIGLQESSRILVFDKYNNLWVSHPYKNVYRINFTDDFTQDKIKIYSQKDGFITDERNYVFNLNGICYLTNPTGVYRYNKDLDLFQLDSSLTKLFGHENHVRRLIQKENLIWAITDRYTASLVIKENGLENKIQIQKFLTLNTAKSYIGGFEELYPYNENIVIISSEDGAIEYNIHKEPAERQDIVIKSVTLKNDSIFYGGYGDLNQLNLSSSQNELRLEFHSQYPNSNRIKEYSYRLLGQHEEWSSWSEMTNKEYTNLDHGDYQFEVKSKNYSGSIHYSEPLAITIDTPWHKSWISSLLLALIFLSGLLALFFLPRKKYRRNTAQLKKEKEETEEEMENIKREKLENEINYKNRELANSTLHLLQKNQTLEALRVKIDELNTNIKSPVVQKELNKMLSIFRSDMRLDEDWNKFSLYFDQVNNNFIQSLSVKFPGLTTKDHKLCAYLKMNLNTKEIAPLLGISVRGVEIGRYRLRKKLGIGKEVNLNDFFTSEFASSEDHIP